MGIDWFDDGAAAPAPTTSAAPAATPPPQVNWFDDAGGPPPRSTAGAPSGPDLGFSDVPGALWSGIKHGIGDVSQTLAGGENAASSPAAAPFELSDLWHPGSGAAKFAYRVGEGSPTIAGGVAGGLGGSALGSEVPVIGNVAGGIGGGALGAAAGNVLQTLGPVYQRELNKTPDDPEGAWSRTKKIAALSGGFTGAAWAAFPVKFIEGPIKNAMFQAFGVQPGLAAAHQVSQNAVEGNPLLQGAGEAAVEGTIGTALPMAGHAAVRGAGRATGILPATADQLAIETADKAHSGEPPTAADLDAIAGQHYDDIRGQKITYSGTAELQRIQNHLRQMLINAGISPKSPIYSEIFSAINDLTESRRDPHIDPATGAATPYPPDWTDIDNVRKRISDAGQSNERRVRRASAIALRGDSDIPGSTGLLDWFADANAQQRAGVPPSLAPELAQKMNLARSYYRAARGMQAFDQIIQRADNSSNDRNVTFRNEIRKVVNGSRAKQAQYPPEVLDLMRDGLQRGFWQAAAHASKLFDPHSSFGLFTNFMSHSMFGPEGLLAMPAAMIARHIGMRPLRQVEEHAPRIIGAQPTGGLPKAPERGARTKASYTPGIGPVPPQTQARGGAVGRALAEARRAAGGAIHLDTGGDPGTPQPQTDAQQPAAEEYGPPIGPFEAQQAREARADGGGVDDAPPDYIGIENHVPQSMPEGMSEPLPLESTEKAPPAAPHNDSSNPFAGLGSNYMHSLYDAWNDASGMTSAGYGDIGQGDFISGVPKVLLGSAAAYATPFTAASKTLVEDPVTQMTGNPEAGQRAGFLAGLPFGGPEASTAKEAMFFAAPFAMAQRASDLKNSGWSNKDIWDELHVFEDKSGQWRTERLGPTRLISDPRDLQDTAGYWKKPLASVIDAPHIFDEPGTEVRGLHPLSDTETESYARPEDLSGKMTRGEYTPYQRLPGALPQLPGPIAVKPKIWTNSLNGEPLSNILHETQHAISQRQGMMHSPAGDKRWFQTANQKDPIWKYYMSLQKNGMNPDDAKLLANHEMYRRQMEEVYARLTSRREDMFNMLHEMDPEQARRFAQSNPFWLPGSSSYYIEDIPRSEQMFSPVRTPRAGGGGVDEDSTPATPFDNPGPVSHLTPQRMLELQAMFEPSFKNRLYSYGAPGDPLEDRRHDKPPSIFKKLEAAHQLMFPEIWQWWDTHVTNRNQPPFVLSPEQQQGTLTRDAGYYDIGRPQ